MLLNKKTALDETAVPDPKSNKNDKNVKNVKKNKKPNIFKRIGLKLKDVFSELKRVTWQSFPKVVKQTLVVIGVVLIFLIVITAFDYGLVSLLRLISPKAV